MSLVPKTATIQVRVVPVVKESSEAVLWRIGLTMSQAIELFLRRLIVDERLPFDVVALQAFQIGGFSGNRPHGHPLTGRPDEQLPESAGENFKERKKGERPRKEFKKFFGARTPSRIRSKRRSKKENI